MAGSTAELDAHLGLASLILYHHRLQRGLTLFATALNGAVRLALELQRPVDAVIQNLNVLKLAEPINAETWIMLGQYGFRYQRNGAAVDYAQRVIDAHRNSWVGGSYTSRIYDDALWLRAEALEKLGDFQSAANAYEDLIDDAPTSKLVDDAAIRRALIFAKNCEDLGPLKDFITVHSDSRHIDTARRHLESCGSPSKASDDSQIQK